MLWVVVAVLSDGTTEAQKVLLHSMKGPILDLANIILLVVDEKGVQNAGQSQRISSERFRTVYIYKLHLSYHMEHSNSQG